MDFRVSVVLPAGGCGSRMGLETPKQYCTLLGRPLLSYTIKTFEKYPWVEAVVVLVAEDCLGAVEAMLREYQHSKVVLLRGRASRHRTIQAGIQHLAQVNRPPDVVLIHDAVRPFVDPDTASSIATAAWKHGAAGVTRPLVSTVIAVQQSGFLDHSLERAKYRASEMPQGFRLNVISQAYDKCSDYDLDYGTECLHLAHKYAGTPALLVEGNPQLWKVTHKKDLYAAEGLIKGEYTSVSLHGLHDNQCLHKALIKGLQARHMQWKDCSQHEPASLSDPGGQPESSCLSDPGSHVVYHPTWVSSALQQPPTKHMPEFRSIHVHIIKTEDVTRDFFCVLSALQSLVSSSTRGDVLHNAVLVQENSCHDAVMNVVVNLVFERNVAFSGQVFIS